MRGRTLNESFVILDEAQNTTPRTDEDVPDAPRLRLARAVVTGDITQIGLAALGKESGLKQVGSILEGVAGIEFIHSGAEDVVRHPLVQRIVTAYAREDAARAGGARGRTERLAGTSGVTRRRARRHRDRARTRAAPLRRQRRRASKEMRRAQHWPPTCAASSRYESSASRERGVELALSRQEGAMNVLSFPAGKAKALPGAGA